MLPQVSLSSSSSFGVGIVVFVEQGKTHVAWTWGIVAILEDYESKDKDWVEKKKQSRTSMVEEIWRKGAESDPTFHVPQSSLDLLDGASKNSQPALHPGRQFFARFGSSETDHV